jgi:hypothetical protein
VALHVAVALEVLAEGVKLEEVTVEPFVLRPGWEHVL